MKVAVLEEYDMNQWVQFGKWDIVTRWFLWAPVMEYGVADKSPIFPSLSDGKLLHWRLMTSCVSSNSACLLAVRLLSPLLSMLWDAIFERESWGRWFPSNYYPNGYFQTCTVWKFHPVSIQQMRGYKLSRTCPPRQQRAVGAFSRPFSRRHQSSRGRRAPKKRYLPHFYDDGSIGSMSL